MIFQHIQDETNNHSLDDRTKQHIKGQAKNEINKTEQNHTTISRHIQQTGSISVSSSKPSMQMGVHLLQIPFLLVDGDFFCSHYTYLFSLSTSLNNQPLCDILLSVWCALHRLTDCVTCHQVTALVMMICCLVLYKRAFFLLNLSPAVEKFSTCDE